MFSIQVVLGIILIHWYADFWCQSEWQAQNKSKQIDALLEHVTKYTSIWALAAIPFFIYQFVLLGHPIAYQIGGFLFITLLAHGITDYFTSKLNAKLATKAKLTNQYHWFFVSVGFDQVLHYVQLFLTYQLFF